MKILQTCLILFALLFTFSISSNAQNIFKKIGKETERKIKRGAEDIIVRKTSDELARRALKPLNNAFDDAFRASYKKKYGDKYSDEQIDSIIAVQGVDYSKFMAEFDKYDELPPSYSFDVIMEVKTKDYDKTEYEITLYHSTTEPIFGMKQDEDGHDQFVVIDNERELAAIYTEEKGEKRVQALSTTLFTDMAAQNQHNNKSMMEDFDMTRTGKTKKILKYLSYEVKGTTKEESYKAYFSDEVPVDWSKTFGPMMQKVAPKAFNDTYQEITGVMLENESKREEDGKKASWKTKKIMLDQNVVFEKKDYKPGMASQ
jgi:hypothetical protein